MAKQVSDRDEGAGGENNFNCRGSAEHRRPVLLLHGTGGNQSDWSVLSPDLRHRGYCVFTVNYGKSNSSVVGWLPNVYGTGDIMDSAAQVAGYVDEILSATGSPQIDIVGHSQGAVVARSYMRFKGGVNVADPSKNKVHSLVTLGGTNHGTTVDGLGNIIRFHPEMSEPVSLILSQAAVQQVIGSAFITKLNEGGDTDAGVQYTAIATKYDRVSTPPANSFLRAGKDATVHNLFVQDIHPDDHVTHQGLSKDSNVVELVETALASTQPPTGAS
ncbi:esterase/lipase family protein [Rhodococcus jostii]|uniref:esterase/lipase family protein n=1 Tax=Rhodococcus jostii TaxID=132919 RepID=UPI003629764E